MSEPKNISPLPDGFSVGSPISEHHGIICCPAINENTDKKYILKIISVPPSQAQLDALLLAGAYKDPADAMDYYRSIGEDILAEAALLKKLSRLDGFLAYELWQMEPITRRRLGYQVFLAGSYKRSLEKYLRKNAVTHLEALNLGMDLCSALSVSRQAGYLYVALKPSNIYVSDKKEYRIGDIGFLNMETLRYASLPERYYGPYTPPELLDPMASMNLTVDTYAVGMILYQLYNDGQLPAADASGALPMPVNADYEMAEIIMKAIHPDPAQRWEDPAELGKALASYMQRNSVNDVPITPFAPPEARPEDLVACSEEQEAAPEAEAAETTPREEAPAEAQAAEEPAEEPAEDPAAGQTAEGAAAQAAAEEAPEAPELLPVPEVSEAPAETVSEDPAQEEAGDDGVRVYPWKFDTAEPAAPEEDPPEEAREAANEDPQGEEAYADMGITEEVTRIVAHADDLIAHEIPEEAVFPEEPEEDPFAFAAEEEDLPEDPDSAEEIPQEAPAPDPKTKKQKNRKKPKSFADKSAGEKIKKFFGRLLLLILLCALCVGGYWYYGNVYLQTVDNISVEGTQDQITVYIDTQVEESALIVTCSDSFGKVHTGAVSGGKTIFSGLEPSTMYTLEVKMNGFHKLRGKTSQVFTTEATTQVLTFTAVAGSEHGSVMLNFTVDGKEPDFWNIRYQAEGEDVRRETVKTHSAMITGLTVGKVYTFKLDGGTNFELSGETTVEFLASRLVLAEDIVIGSENGQDITVSWRTPGDAVVNSWNVRCYTKNGLDAQETVTGNQVQFSGINPAENYTVEITAEGMIQPAKAFITADPLNITQFHADESRWKEMKLTWDYTGTAPEAGWVLVYTTDGANSQSVKCEKPAAVIPNYIPNTEYRFTVYSADDRSIYNNVFVHRTNAAEAFGEHNIKVDQLTMHLLKTPEEADWRGEDQTDAFTNTFAAGDSVSVVLHSANDFYVPSNETQILYVFRSSFGSVLPELVSMDSIAWKQIWFGGDHQYGELTIPKTPTAPGEYQLELYFNGKLVKSAEYIVSA